MLLLRDLEIRNVVKQKLAEAIRRQVEQLAPGAVQQHLAQGLDFIADTDPVHGFSFPRVQQDSAVRRYWVLYV